MIWFVYYNTNPVWKHMYIKAIPSAFDPILHRIHWWIFSLLRIGWCTVWTVQTVLTREPGIQLTLPHLCTGSSVLLPPPIHHALFMTLDTDVQTPPIPYHLSVTSHIPCAALRTPTTHNQVHWCVVHHMQAQECISQSSFTLPVFFFPERIRIILYVGSLAGF